MMAHANADTCPPAALPRGAGGPCLCAARELHPAAAGPVPGSRRAYLTPLLCFPYPTDCSISAESGCWRTIRCVVIARVTRSELDFDWPGMDVTMALQCRNAAVLAVGEGVGRRRREQGRAVIEVCSMRRRSSVDVKFAIVSRTAASAHGVRCGGPLAAQDHGRFEESALSPHAVGKSREGRGWRLYAAENGSSSHRGEVSATGGLHATVEKADDNASTQEKDTQRFGSSEAACDEGSSFLAMESVLENDGGKSVEDYKLRAHIFSEGAIFFAALKDRDSHSAVQ